MVEVARGVGVEVGGASGGPPGVTGLKDAFRGLGPGVAHGGERRGPRRVDGDGLEGREDDGNDKLPERGSVRAVGPARPVFTAPKLVLLLRRPESPVQKPSLLAPQVGVERRLHVSSPQTGREGQPQVHVLGLRDARPVAGGAVPGRSPVGETPLRVIEPSPGLDLTRGRRLTRRLRRRPRLTEPCGGPSPGTPPPFGRAGQGPHRLSGLEGRPVVAGRHARRGGGVEGPRRPETPPLPRRRADANAVRRPDPLEPVRKERDEAFQGPDLPLWETTGLNVFEPTEPVRHTFA